MKDRIWRWTRLGEQRRLHIRYWLKSPWWSLRWWFKSGNFPGDFRLKTQPGENGICYCPFGSQTLLHTRLFGSGLLVWFGRDPTVRPCHCDKIMAELFPESYADEVLA